MDTNKPIIYEFDGNKIEFLLNDDENVKVNATQMAKIFQRKTTKFLKTDNTKAFIEVSKRDPNGSQIIEDRGRNGIYFSRILAIKFAAWLSPEFEYWVYMTIERLIFGIFAEQKKRMKKKAKNLNRIDELEKELADNPKYKELTKLQDKNEKAGRKNRSENSQQLNFYRDFFNEKSE